MRSIEQFKHSRKSTLRNVTQCLVIALALSSAPSGVGASILSDRTMKEVHRRVLGSSCLIFLARTLFTNEVALNVSTPAYRKLVLNLETHLSLFNEKELKLESRTYGAFPGHVYWQLKHYDSAIADVYSYYDRGMLIFDIEVSPHFTGFGAYRLMMETVLIRYPKTKVMPAIMLETTSDSAKIFFRELKRLSANKVYAEERDRVIQAFLNMPSTKVRIAHGFGKLTYLDFNLEQKIIRFEMEYGPFSIEEWKSAIALPNDSRAVPSGLQKYMKIRKRHVFEAIPWW